MPPPAFENMTATRSKKPPLGVEQRRKGEEGLSQTHVVVSLAKSLGVPPKVLDDSSTHRNRHVSSGYSRFAPPIETRKD